jgi:choline dehydrogenase-like flavoprotein
MTRVSLPSGFSPDVVVLGTGLTGCMLITELLGIDPGVKVLALDCGSWVSQDHGQTGCAGLSFLDPICFSRWENASALGVPGTVEAVGGASLAWSAWSPSPRPHELAHWPSATAARLQGDLVPAARERLGVTTRHSGTPVARELATRISGAASDGLLRGVDRDRATDGWGAPIALSSGGHAFSPVPRLARLAARQAPGQGKEAAGPLLVLPDHRVVRLQTRAGRVRAVITSRGRLDIAAGVPVVLALNTVETTRQIMLAAPDLAPAGGNLAAHVLSEILVRVPLSRPRGDFGWGALLVPGQAPDRSFHIQVHAGAGQPGALRRMIPGLSGEELLGGCDDSHLVINLAALGELPARGSGGESAIRLSQARVDEYGVPVPVLALREDVARDPVWDACDDALDDLCAVLAGSGACFRGPGDPPGCWRPRPPQRTLAEYGGRRWGHCVHLSGSARMGSAPSTAVTDETGAVFGFDRLFATGLGVFPRAGSHNGGLTAAALALGLARVLASQ